MRKVSYHTILSERKIIFVLLILTMLLLLSCSSSSTEPDAGDLSLQFSPAEQIVPADTAADYAITIENAEGLFAFSTEIVFNNTIAELVQDAVVIGDFWNAETVELNVLEEDRLSIAISLQQTPENNGIDGDGELFSFSILGSTIGQTTLTFEELQLLDENGNDIPNFNNIEIINGNLIVE